MEYIILQSLNVEETIKKRARARSSIHTFVAALCMAHCRNYYMCLWTGMWVFSALCALCVGGHVKPGFVPKFSQTHTHFLCRLGNFRGSAGQHCVTPGYTINMAWDPGRGRQRWWDRDRAGMKEGDQRGGGDVTLMGAVEPLDLLGRAQRCEQGHRSWRQTICHCAGHSEGWCDVSDSIILHWKLDPCLSCLFSKHTVQGLNTCS